MYQCSSQALPLIRPSFPRPHSNHQIYNIYQSWVKFSRQNKLWSILNRGRIYCTYLTLLHVRKVETTDTESEILQSNAVIFILPVYHKIGIKNLTKYKKWEIRIHLRYSLFCHCIVVILCFNLLDKLSIRFNIAKYLLGEGFILFEAMSMVRIVQSCLCQQNKLNPVN